MDPVKPTDPGYRERFGKNIPVMLDLLIDLRRCTYFGFEIGHPIREAIMGLIRIELPILKARIAQSRADRDEKNRKPQQMRLFA